jgi:GNAT superfamily N-acetyltransferase
MRLTATRGGTSAPDEPATLARFEMEPTYYKAVYIDGSGVRSMFTGSILPAESKPENSDLLADQHRRFLESSHPGWGSNQANALARQRANGSLSALLWEPKAGGARGLAWIQTLRMGIRIHGLWVDPASPEILTALLADLERERNSPIVAVTDVLPGLTSKQQPRFFGPMGFWHRAKVLMRRDPKVPVGANPGSPKIRPIERSDLKAVVGVYVRAYSDRPGEFWTWGAPDAWTEAEQDVMSHLNKTGEWTPNFLPYASLVWEEGGNVLGAVLVEARRDGIPYVEDLVVEPQFHRRGIGRSLLGGAIDQLVRDGPRAIELAALRFGAPYQLYRTLGFDEVPPPKGELDGHWIRGKSPFRARESLAGPWL